MTNSQFVGWLSRREGRDCLKMVFSMTGGSAVQAFELCERLYLRLPDSLNLTDRQTCSDISRREIYRLADKVLQGEVPPLVPKERSSRFTEGKMKASLIYHEQTFQVVSDSEQYVIAIPFLYERHTGLLFSMKLVDIRPVSRINFIRKVISALQSGFISPWQKQIQIQTLSLPKRIIQRHQSAELIKSELIAHELPLAKTFQVVEWAGHTQENTISFNMSETGLIRALSSWIKFVNQYEIENIAEFCKRDLQHQVIVKNLFPYIEKTDADLREKDNKKAFGFIG